jgi:uncharacterized protein (TIGR03000 family)
MYSMVLLMALSNGAATAERADVAADSARYGNHLQHEQYRRGRRGCGGCGGGYSGGCGGYYGGGYGRYAMGGYGPGYYAAGPTRMGRLGGRSYGMSRRAWRRGGSGPMWMNDGYYGTSMAMGPSGPGSYQSFYAPQAPARIEVRMPPGASLTIDGEPSQSRESVRLLETPPLATNQDYVYHLTARIPRDGREVTEKRDVHVRGGQISQVVFPLPSGSNPGTSRERTRTPAPDTNRERGQ